MTGVKRIIRLPDSHDRRPRHERGCLRDIWVRSPGDLHGGGVAGGLTMAAPNDRANDDLQDDIIQKIRAARRADATAFGFEVARVGTVILLV